MNKTAIAIAVLMATSACSAAGFPEVPGEDAFDQIINDKTAYERAEWNGVGKVIGRDDDDGDKSGHSFLATHQATGAIDVTNKGTIWAVADSDKSDDTVGKYVNGISASAGKTGINEGTIYVQYKDVSSNLINFESAKGMVATANGSSESKSTIQNNSKIVVQGGTGMMVSDGGAGKYASVINNGEIEVYDAGFGMSFGKGDVSGVDMTNTGTISVSGSHAIGVSLSDANQGTFINKGTIIAEDGAVAISSQNAFLTHAGIPLVDGELNVVLTEDSHVVGDIFLNSKSSLTADNLNNAETITLGKTNGSFNTVGAVKVINGSDLTIKSANESEVMTIEDLVKDADSNLTFEFGSVATDSDGDGALDHLLLDVEDVSGVEGSVDVSYTGKVSDALANNEASVGDLIGGIKLGDDNSVLDKVTVSEGKWGDGLVLDNAGNILSRTTNSLLSSTTDLALMNGLVWRSQLTNLSDRMGTLRTMPQAAGAWARYNNGRLDGRGIEYDYNTIEVGFDAPVSSNFLVGVSFDYTIGDTDLNAGSADNDVYTLGLYGTYFGDNGGFVDLMAKIGRIDNEYDISNKSGVENGDYMMTGAIVGIEAGHRFDLAHNTFVEPQVQLSYSWLRASDYSTNVRSVDFETIESLVARVGVMGGIKFNENRGAAYLKASYNHDFLGDVDAEYSALDGSMSHPFKISDELDDNWAEVSLGFSYNVTDSFNTFLDVGTGFGGDIDQKWRVNFGGRYTF